MSNLSESHSPDGDGLGMTGPDTASDSAFVRASYDAGTAKSSGQTTAAKAERKSPKAGSGSNPDDSRQSCGHGWHFGAPCNESRGVDGDTHEKGSVVAEGTRTPEKPTAPQGVVEALGLG